MDSLFCCESIEPYKSKRLDHESKFTSFMNWAQGSSVDAAGDEDRGDVASRVANAPYAVQLVRQVNFGPLESKRYFSPLDGIEGTFVEISEQDLIEANLKKLNTFKNFKCDDHNKFFEVNVYQRDPINKHHWRANVARPAGSIDL